MGEWPSGPMKYASTWGMVFVFLLGGSLLGGCSKGSAPQQQNVKEIGSVDVKPAETDKLQAQEVYQVGPFELTMGSSDVKNKKTMFELRNKTGDAVPNVVLRVTSPDQSALFGTKDQTIQLSEDKKVANIGNVGPKKDRILEVDNVPKDQFEIYMVYGKDKQQVRLYPQESNGQATGK
ncbi:hypothetical protein GJ688_13070 [Heliobacillus mobilis]|uniref:Uncharacterized protein n=1 Tax=Heliobacterium mobile TaxID=28064 RepID=A0A6I3SMF0_HELMO|nr:hypothetical protein [Heliobacterium mobile]MTV49905.1 hypothetical protein [Heliobacterium mobile]